MKANPGGEIAPSEVIGRDDITRRLWRVLERQSLILSAERRMGKTRITTVLQLYDKRQITSELGKGLVVSIRELMSPMVSDASAHKWWNVWQELTSDRSEFQIPLRLLNTAVRYRQTKSNPRVLLELPIEERRLLKPLLGLEE